MEVTGEQAITEASAQQPDDKPIKTTAAGLPIFDKKQQATSAGLPIFKKEPDFNHGYQPTPDDIAKKKSFQNLEDGFDKLNNGSKPSQSTPQEYKNLLDQNFMNSLAKQQKQHKADLENESSQYYQQKTKAREKEDADYAKIPLADKVKSLSNNLIGGVSDIAKGAVRQAANVEKYIFNPNDPLGKKIQENIDKAAEDINKNYIEKGAQAASFNLPEQEKEILNNKGLMGGLNGFVNFLPAMAAAERTGGTSLFFNDYEKGYEDIDKLDKQNKLNLTEGQKQLYANVRGLTSAIVMTHGVNAFLKGTGEKVEQGILDKVSQNAIADLAQKGEDATAGNIHKAINVQLDNIADRIKNQGIKSLKTLPTSVADMAGMEALNIGTEKLVNTVTGKKVFNQDDIADRMKNAIGNGILFHAAGSLLRAPLALAKGSEQLNSVADNLYKDPSDENKEAVKQGLVQHLQETGVPDDEIAKTLNTVDNIHKSVKALPKGLTDEQVGKKVEEGLNTEEQKTEIGKQITDIDDKIGQIPKEEADPVKSAENEVALEDLEKQKDELNNNLKQIIKKQHEKEKEESVGANVAERPAERGQSGDETGENQEVNAEQHREEDEKEKDDVTVKSGEAKAEPEITKEKQKKQDEIPEVASQRKKMQSILDNPKNHHEWQVEQANNFMKSPLNFFKGVIRYHTRALEDDPTNLYNKQGEEKFKPIVDKLEAIENKYKGKSLKEGETTHAVKIESAGKMDVGKPPEDGSKVGEGNAEPKETAEQGKEKEAVKEPLGISKERTKKQREERGLEDIPESEHTTLREMFDEGQRAINSGEVKPREVANEVADNKRNLSSTEVNALLTDRRSLHDESERLRDMLSKTNPDTDPITHKVISDKLSHVEGQLDKNEQALRAGARENSLALNSMRSMINADYSHTSQAARMRAKAGGKLTAEMEAELKRYDDELRKAKKEFEDYKAAESERRAKEATDLEIKKSERTAKKLSNLSAIKQAKKENVDKFLSKLADIRKSGTLSADIPYRRELAAAVPFVKTHVSLLIKEGIIEFKDIIDNIHDEFSKHVADLTKQDIVDILAGRYDEKKSTKNELLGQKNAIIRIAKLTKRLEDLKNGVESEKSERKIVKKRQEIVDLESEIKKLQKQHSIETLEARTQESLQKRLDKINERIKNNDFEPPQPRAKIESPSAKTIKLQAAVRRAENNFDAMADRLDMHKKTKLTKALDKFRKVRLAFILSGTKVLGKLFGFGEAKKVTNQLDEMMNHINSKLPGLKNVINRSPRYAGGYNPTAEIKALVARYNLETLKDVWEAAKTGANDLDRIYGKQGVDRDFEGQHSILNLFQNIHKALKTPTQRSEFFRSMEHRLTFYAQQGDDINDPDIQFKAGFEAYADSKKAILMNDNLLTDKFYKVGLRNLEHSKEGAAQALGAFIRNQFPITKVPTNFALNVYDRITGAIPGISRATPLFWKAISKGAESLTNDEADSVARIFSKGQVGLALMALAYYSPDLIQLGGYNSGKRSDKDLKEGDVVVGGVSIPHNLAHNDVIEAMQFAATVRRAQDYADEKMKPGGTFTGIGQGFKGIASQIPFVDNRYLDDITSTNKATAAAGTYIKNFIEPRLLQEFAEYGDKNTDKKFIQHPIDYMLSETKKRDPQSILESLKTGIPGWRQTVPEKQTGIGKRLSTMKDETGDKITLSTSQIKQRKEFADEGVKDLGKYWKDEFDGKYNNEPKQVKERDIKQKYWKSIGRSDNWIKSKLNDEYQKALNSYLETKAVEYSEARMKPELAKAKKKNTFSIR